MLVALLTLFLPGMQVGVATDTARKVRAELAMGKYGDLDRLYDE